MARFRRSSLVALDAAVADLRACTGCGGVVEAGMPTCPSCGRWLGPGTPGLWGGLVVAGSLLILLAFFLPWLNGVDQMRGRLLSGYDLARIAQQLAVTAVGARPTAAASIALYLAPLTGLLLLLLLALTLWRQWHWTVVGRLVVGLAAIPCQLALLAALFSVGLLGDGHVTGWPHVGLLMTGLGSLLVIGSGIALGGRRRSAR